MRMLRLLVLAAPLGILAACSGTGSSTSAGAPATPAELAAATPSISGVGLVDSTADVTPSYVAPAPGPLDLLSQVDDDACNPHLFLRSEEVVDRVNRHFYKFLVHIEDAIAKHPALTAGDSATWTATRDGVDASLTVSRLDTYNYDWTLYLAPVATPATSTKVAYGTFDTENATTAHQGTGTLNLDLSALASVTREEVAGTIAATFSNFPSYKLTSVQATDVIWDTDSRNPIRAAPRSSSYVAYRQTGIGGSLVFQEQEEVPTACPTDRYSMMPAMYPVAAPATTTAQVELVNRWYLVAPSTSTTPAFVVSPSTSTGPAAVAIHGRSDAQISTLSGEGVTPSGIAKLVALTCHQSDFSWMTPVEGEWLLKAEDASGKTLWGREFLAGNGCDPQLNPLLSPSNTTTPVVPTLDSNATDFNFAGVSFTTPYIVYPGGKLP